MTEETKKTDEPEIEKQILENKLGVTQDGEKFIATRHIVEQFTPERLINMVKATDQRIMQQSAQIEAMMLDRDKLVEARKEWNDAYGRALKVMEARPKPVAPVEAPKK